LLPHPDPVVVKGTLTVSRIFSGLGLPFHAPRGSCPAKPSEACDAGSVRAFGSELDGMDKPDLSIVGCPSRGRLPAPLRGAFSPSRRSQGCAGTLSKCSRHRGSGERHPVDRRVRVSGDRERKESSRTRYAQAVASEVVGAASGSGARGCWARPSRDMSKSFVASKVAPRATCTIARASFRMTATTALRLISPA
jgi:hypothetical protein